MAHLMIVQGSGRRKGFTASLMTDIVEALKAVETLEVETFHLHDFSFKPCTSCFNCIRNIGSGCVIDDDFGKKGEGALYRAFGRANGLLVVDPVHGWGMSAMTRVFLERIYPFIWEGVTNGMPFASIACASNQGFQSTAIAEHCKKAAGYAFRYIGGLPVHTAYIEKARKEAVKLAHRIADAAIENERSGRKRLTDADIFTMYAGAPWDIVDGYIDNLTDGSFNYESSVPARALAEGTFTDPDARDLLVKACEHLRRVFEFYGGEDLTATAIELSKAAKYWTNATFKQFLEKDVVKTTIPKAYRPLDEL